MGTDSSIILESAASVSLDETDSFSIPPPAELDVNRPPALPTWQTHQNTRDNDILDEVGMLLMPMSSNFTIFMILGNKYMQSLKSKSPYLKIFSLIFVVCHH